jgi:glycosyltransferase involved in cell wall biosynthesis
MQKSISHYPELIGQEVRGWLVSNSSDRISEITNLTEKLIKVRESRKEIISKGTLASKFVIRNYIWDEIVERMVKIISREMRMQWQGYFSQTLERNKNGKIGY